MVKEIQTHATPATIFFLNCENASAWPDGFRSSEPTFLFPEELLYRHNSRRKPSMKTVLKNITWPLTSSLPNECLHKQALGWVSKANLAHCTPPRISQGFASDSRRNSQSSELHQNYRRKKNTLTWRKKTVSYPGATAALIDILCHLHCAIHLRSKNQIQEPYSDGRTKCMKLQ